MKIVNFIVEHWDIITLIVAAVAAVVFAIFKGNKSVIMRILYTLVTDAERVFGSGTGEQKLAAVVDWIYPRLPAIIKVFVTDKMLVRWIEKALAAAKEAWENNPELIAGIGQDATDYEQDAAEGEESAEAE